MRPLSWLVALALAACVHADPGPANAASPGGSAGFASHDDGVSHDDAATLRAIAAIHGGAGPWVVAGYRMGQYALRQLGLPRGSFDLEVIHYAPQQVQFSCIADGAAAATGASLGRLNLRLAAATAAQTRTTYRRRSTGETITLHTTAAFAARYLNVPRPQLSTAGRQVLHLPDAAIFERAAPVTPPTPAPARALAR